MAERRNECYFAGVVVSDPQRRHEKGPVSFTMAVRRLVPAGSQVVSDTPKVDAWGELGEKVLAEVKKGKILSVTTEFRVNVVKKEGQDPRRFESFQLREYTIHERSAQPEEVEAEEQL